MYMRHNSPQGKVRLSRVYYLLLLCLLFISHLCLICWGNELSLNKPLRTRESPRARSTAATAKITKKKKKHLKELKVLYCD